MSRTTILMSTSLVGLCLFLYTTSHAVPDQSFFDKEQEIRKDLYKISAKELQVFLGCHVDPIIEVSAEELKAAMELDPDLCVINVLPAALYDDCHITNSINVPLKQLVSLLMSWDRDKKIIVYCALHECDAGEKAYILLSCLGFTDIADYKGGIKEWYQLGYPTEGPAAFSYLHAKTETLPEQFLVCSYQFIR